MNVQISSHGNHTVISVQGRLDTATSTDFESRVIETILPGAKIIIDCEKLDYISSSGLRVFLIALKKTNNSGGELKICNLQPAINEIFKISGFTNIFLIFDDIDSATA